MTKTILILCLLSSLKGLTLDAQSDSLSTLEITFTEIRSPEGQIAININTPAEDFPNEPGLEIQFEKEGIKDGVLVAVVKDLPYGSYAISVLDDLNYDMEMDLLLGMPREGYGFSMNPEFRLRTPKFEDCAFQLNQPLQQITIHMRYHGKNK